MTRHCYHCGSEWTSPGQPGRSERCHSCGSDLRVCLNCASHDVRSAHQCRDRRADPVEDKDKGTFCEYFDFVRRVYTAQATDPPRASSAREQFKKLFGD